MLISQNGRLDDTLIHRADGLYEVSYVPQNNELYQTVPVICGQFFAPAEYYASVYVPAAHRQEKAAYCALYEQADVLEEKSFKLLTNVIPRTSEEKARAYSLKTKLKSIVNAEIVSMVTHGVTEEGRASFLQRLKEAGSEEYKEINQNTYDRWQGEK